jgi:hypothetical protein
MKREMAVELYLRYCGIVVFTWSMDHSELVDEDLKRGHHI